jgi:C2 domain
MSYDEIQEECMKDSLNWLEKGSGRFGRLFVEIIGCDDLPNLDTGGFAGNKTDSFVSLVYEDTLAQTDIIDDSLSPRWMPWTKRAFIFHMFHSSSDLFVAVFDHDGTMNPADDHDFIGRVAVDVSKFRKDTIYTLRYDLHTTSRMANLPGKRNYRNRMGTITLRIRLEIEDEQKQILSNLEPPPNMYVNVKTRREFRYGYTLMISFYHRKSNLSSIYATIFVTKSRSKHLHRKIRHGQIQYGLY